MACSCNKKGVTTDCSSVVVEDFKTYLDTYVCLRDSGRTVEAGMDAGYVQAKIEQLQAAIANKKADIKSCTYTPYINTYNIDFNKIINLNICQ